MNRERIINELLTEAFNPIELLEVTNESFLHHVPANSETHFKVVLVTEKFQGITRVNRHRQVNQLLIHEMQNGLHALSMHLYTPEEWKKAKDRVNPSPKCRDGYRHTER